MIDLDERIRLLTDVIQHQHYGRTLDRLTQARYLLTQAKMGWYLPGRQADSQRLEQEAQYILEHLNDVEDGPIV